MYRQTPNCINLCFKIWNSLSLKIDACANMFNEQEILTHVAWRWSHKVPSDGILIQNRGNFEFLPHHSPPSVPQLTSIHQQHCVFISHKFNQDLWHLAQNIMMRSDWLNRYAPVEITSDMEVYCDEISNTVLTTSISADKWGHKPTCINYIVFLFCKCCHLR